MSLKIRFAILSGVLAVVFLGALQTLRVLEQARAEQLWREALATDQATVRQWLELTNQPLRRFVDDYAEWPALAAWVAQPEPAWADAQLKSNLASYEAQTVWILDAKGRVLYAARQQPGPPLPLPAGLDGWLQGPMPHPGIFTECRDGLLELWSAPIGTDRRGFIVTGRVWTEPYLASLARLTEAKVLLAPADWTKPRGNLGHEVDLPLLDPNGQVVRHLVVRFSTPDFGPNVTHDLRTAYLFAAFGALLVVALWLAMRQWVLRPLAQIGESLTRNNLAAVGPLLTDRAELGYIARLVQTSFAQKAALETAIDEHRRTETALRESERAVRAALEVRARLARDLHDGVIQSIYAAGLGLEGAISQIDQAPAASRTRLQLCRSSLNDVIREVRGFINGIDLEDLHTRGFHQELLTLTRTLQALWPVAIDTDVDATVAARLNSHQELQALQISRECLSNAVRHGGARKIRIQLGTDGDKAFLEVEDNGCGFDVAAARSRSSGLDNLAVRARELNGALQIDSQPQRGTIVRVTFSLFP